MMRLPHMTKRVDDFMKIVGQLRLEARPAGSLDQWETTGDWPKPFGDTVGSGGFGSTVSSLTSDVDSDDEMDSDEEREIVEEEPDEERDKIRSGGGAVCIGYPHKPSSVACDRWGYVLTDCVWLQQPGPAGAH